MGEASEWACEYAVLTLSRIERVELGLDRLTSSAIAAMEPGTSTQKEITTLLDSVNLISKIIKGFQTCLQMRHELQAREEAKAVDENIELAEPATRKPISAFHSTPSREEMNAEIARFVEAEKSAQGLKNKLMNGVSRNR